MKPHTFTVLKHLDQWGLTNHVLVITRYRVDPEDCAVLNSFGNIRLTVLVTHSGIDDDRIEPVDSQGQVKIAECVGLVTLSSTTPERGGI